MLRPLVRLLIGSGIPFPVFADLVRGLYVDVAQHDLLPDPRARTDSRISLMTGVHRKEIRRLRTEHAAPDAVPERVTLGSQIVARWLGTPGYTDSAGRPLPLPRTAPEDGAPSFEGLVAGVTTDVRPRAVLDDWLDQNIVALGPDGLVRLNDAAFIPRPGREAQLFYFARNLHDHIAAAAANVAADPAGPAPFVDRSVHYDQLSPDIAARLAALGRDAAQALLLDVNRAALALLDGVPDGDAPASAAAGGPPTQRVNLGVYLYVEDEPSGGET